MKRPQESEIIQQLKADFGELGARYYTERLLMAVALICKQMPIEAQILWYAIINDSGLNAPTHDTGNSGTTYLLGMRDLGYYLNQLFLESKTGCSPLIGQQSMMNHINDQVKKKAEQ